jgi:hypothetical protein
MNYSVNRKLANFDFWAGAVAVAEVITYSEFQLIEECIEDVFGDGVTETQINDIFWFETELICSIIGITQEELDERY